MKICRELIFCLILFGALFSGAGDATAAAPGADQSAFPRSTDSYNDQGISDLWQRLAFSATSLWRGKSRILVNASPDQEFKSSLGNGEVEAVLAEPFNFQLNRRAADLPLHLRREGPEHDLLVETSDKFWSEESVQLGDYRAFERGERQAGRAKKLLRADVAE